jgi:hypothetical protein
MDAPVAVFDPEELRKRPKKLKKLNKIASRDPLKTTCFDRDRRFSSVASLKKQFHIMEVLSDQSETDTVANDDKTPKVEKNTRASDLDVSFANKRTRNDEQHMGMT